MSHRSVPRLLVLHGLRLKGVADAAAVAAAVDLPVEVVARELESLADAGLAMRRDGLLTGWSLTLLGRREHQRLLGDELDRVAARPTVETAYGEFRSLNPGVLDAVSRWQVRTAAGSLVRNDHSDPTYDERVLDDLSGALVAAKPIGDVLGRTLDRFRPYAPHLEVALDRARSGELEYVAKPVIPSFHTVWFEWHEDLLVTLGLDRASEQEGA